MSMATMAPVLSPTEQANSHLWTVLAGNYPACSAWTWQSRPMRPVQTEFWLAKPLDVAVQRELE